MFTKSSVIPIKYLMNLAYHWLFKVINTCGLVPYPHKSPHSTILTYRPFRDLRSNDFYIQYSSLIINALDSG